jgi:hypothetical protein
VLLLPRLARVLQAAVDRESQATPSSQQVQRLLAMARSLTELSDQQVEALPPPKLMLIHHATEALENFEMF